MPDDELMDRISGRRVHVPSGRTYHTKYNPPKVEGLDDITGEPLTIRYGDAPENAKTRIE